LASSVSTGGQKCTEMTPDDRKLGSNCVKVFSLKLSKTAFDLLGASVVHHLQI
jgi:hypothetical protein